MQEIWALSISTERFCTLGVFPTAKIFGLVEGNGLGRVGLGGGSHGWTNEPGRDSKQPGGCEREGERDVDSLSRQAGS